MGNEIVEVSQTSLAQVHATEIDMQIATARKYPRDEERSIEKATKLATANLKIAQSCEYFRPVGKKDGRQQFASGPAIRAAEIFKITWGNIRIAKRVIGTRDGSVGVEWAGHDLETNMMDRGEVWRPYFNNEKMIPVITSAAMKIAERDAVFAAVPKVYADQVLEECRAMIVGEGEDKAALMTELVEKFAEMGVDKAKLFTAVDPRKHAPGSNDELVFLIGLYNALKDGICSVDECFGNAPASTKPQNVEVKAGKPRGAKAAVVVEEPEHILNIRTVADHYLGLKTSEQINKILFPEFGCTIEKLPNDPALLKSIDELFNTIANADSEAAQNV